LDYQKCVNNGITSFSVFQQKAKERTNAATNINGA